MTEENMKKYPEVDECNIAVVQQGSLSIFESIQAQKDAVGTKSATVEIVTRIPETETMKEKEEKKEIPACYLQGNIVDVHALETQSNYHVILDNGTVIHGKKDSIA